MRFLYLAAPAIYGQPPVFDFGNGIQAEAAIDAVNDVLNAEGGVLAVGSAASAGMTFFSVGWGFEIIEIPIPFSDESLSVPNIFFVRSLVDPASPDVWMTDGVNMNDHFLERHSYASFRVVAPAGSGNQPPLADAGGPYVGTQGSPVHLTVGAPVIRTARSRTICGSWGRRHRDRSVPEPHP